MIKSGKYLIAKISGQGQEIGASERKILDVYFRYKDYLDSKENPDWFSASLEDVWSPNFLGLKEYFYDQPIEKIKKLEYQNPCYSGAFRFFGKNGDPRNYAKVFTIQIAGCNFKCNYCYVPSQLKTGDENFGKYFSAKEIVDNFLKVKEEKKSENWNVFRISGGEPLTIVPEIVLDIQKEIEKRSPSTYLWIDTNLSTPKYLKKFEKRLKAIFQKKNVGIVGCFKGVDESDFSILTGVGREFYQNQFETARLLAEWKADVYFYLPALVYGDKTVIEGKLENFVKKLRKIHRNLPLRLEVFSIIKYPAAKENIEEKAKEGRALPETIQYVVFDLWYNKILPKFYSREELEKYCCEIKIN